MWRHGRPDAQEIGHLADGKIDQLANSDIRQMADATGGYLLYTESWCEIEHSLVEWQDRPNMWEQAISKRDDWLLAGMVDGANRPMLVLQLLQPMGGHSQ